MLLISKTYLTMESRVFELIKIDRNAKFNYSLSSAAKMKKSNKNIQIFKSITFCYGKSHLTQVSINSIICLLLISSFAQAQQELSTINYSKKFINQIEILAGPNLIYPKEKYMENREIKIGYCLGVGLVHEISSYLDVDLKMSYENKGSQSSTLTQNNDFNPPAAEQFIQNVTLNYLTASLYPKFKFNISNKHGIVLAAGPYMGRLLNTRLKTELFRNDSLVHKYGSRPDPFIDNKKYDFGITTLVGYGFSILTIKGIIQIHYNIGLRNIKQPTISEFRNQTLSLLLGINLLQ